LSLTPTLFPYTTLFRSSRDMNAKMLQFTVEETNLIGIYRMPSRLETILELERMRNRLCAPIVQQVAKQAMVKLAEISDEDFDTRSEEHTSELQSRFDLV